MCRGQEVESRISAIARQNQNSKVAPVSSFQWATILKAMGTASNVTLALRANRMRKILVFVDFRGTP